MFRVTVFDSLAASFIDDYSDEEKYAYFDTYSEVLEFLKGLESDPFEGLQVVIELI